MEIRTISVDFFRSDQRDSGCARESANILRGQTNRYDHALVVFDWHGSGCEQLERAELEGTVKSDLEKNGWANLAEVVVIGPELEAWIWSNSPHVAKALGWEDSATLREWLEDHNLLDSGSMKPPDPKRAMEAVLRIANRRPSSTIFHQLASTVSFRGCTDPAFQKLCRALRDWFPA